MTFHVPNNNRIRQGRLASSDDYGNNGAFFLPFTITPKKNKVSKTGLWIIASDGAGWEHVSVSAPGRCPSWGEMCRVKELFWDPEDVVIQYHPAASDYVNTHPHTLHLWRPIGVELPTPDPILVGILDP